MDFQEIISHFDIKKNISNNAVQAMCPAHNDKHASLSIKYDSVEGKTFMICHAGCEVKEVVQSVGLKVSDLFDKPLPPKPNEKKENSNIEAIYKFTDVNGKLLYEKVRFKGKRFSHRRYIDGYVVWGMDEGVYTETFPNSNEYSKKERPGAKELWFPSEEHTLYNLPNLVQAIQEEEIVYICEGEKDADNLIRMGLVATTTSIGASKGDVGKKWRKEFNSYFKDADVALLPDHDLAGQNFMDYVATHVKDLARTVKVIELPGLENKEDVSDWLEKGYDIYDLKKLIDKTEEWTNYKGDIIGGFNWSDVGNAERFIALYGKDSIFNCNSGKWYNWNGVFWKEDIEFETEYLFRNMIRKFQRAIPSIERETERETKKAHNKALGFVLKCESDGKIKAGLNQAKTFRGMHFIESDMDNYLFNTPNITLNLRNMEIKEHNRRDLITQCSSQDYNKDSYCPNWNRFLNKIFLGDEEIINYIQKAVGYSLTADMKEQCLFMLWGGGCNGKSTFVRALEDVMGTYAATIKGKTLMESKGDEGARGDLARLTNKRVVIASELQEGQVFDEPLLKVLSAGETLPVRFMYQEEFMLKPKFKLWIMTNKKPTIKGNDYGIWRRFRMIPFKYKFTDEEKDSDFYEKYLEPELEGILNWAIEGFVKWKEEGFKTPLQVTESIADYKNEMDQVARYLEDCCITEQDLEIKSSELYNEYRSWCDREGEIFKMSN
ncbi:MAG: phage/plasmid primase, P4 family, partial [Sarcina sp.]